MDNNSILMIVSVLVFLFGAFLFVIGVGLGGFIGLVAIITFIVGWARKRNDIKVERIRAEQKEEGS